MIKRKHPSDRAERRRLKNLKDKRMGPMEPLVSPEYRTSTDARNPTELEVLERTPEAPVPKLD